MLDILEKNLQKKVIIINFLTTIVLKRANKLVCRNKIIEKDLTTLA